MVVGSPPPAVVACSAWCPAHQSLGGFRSRVGYRCAGASSSAPLSLGLSSELPSAAALLSSPLLPPLSLSTATRTCSLGATLAAPGGCAPPFCLVERDVARHDDLAVVGQDAVALHVGLVAHHDAADGMLSSLRRSSFGCSAYTVVIHDMRPRR